MFSQENMPEKELHNFSVRLQNRPSRLSTILMDESKSKCNCSPKDGISMSCHIVVQAMTNAGLTEEAVSCEMV